VRIAALPPTSLANGLAMSDDGTLYVADSALGVIWRVPASGGTPTQWASGPELAPAGFLGANGLKIHDNAVWVTNTDQGTILRIPSAPAVPRVPSTTWPSPTTTRSSPPSTRSASLPSSGSTAPAPSCSPRRMACPTPTSVAVAGQTLYLPSAAYITRNDPNLLLAHLTR
jgi:DNA-binding beta-propeller fold protein YncE